MSAQSLKPGWKMVKFGDVVRQCKESVDRDNNPFERYVEGGHMDSEDIHLRRWGEFGVDYVGPAFHRIFRKSQVLYGSRRTYLKKIAMVDFDGITANTTFVCETRNKNILIQELLPFLMLADSFTEHAIRESKGSTNPYINWPDIAKYVFPLPPLNEQKRIAEILWAADEAVGKWKICQSSLESLIESIVEETAKKASYKGWRFRALGDVATVERGKFSHRPRNLPQFYGGLYPFAQTGDVQRANGFIRKFEYTLTDEGKHYSKSFPPGTILITIAAVIGATAITEVETWATDSVVGIVSGDEINVYFLEYFLRTRRHYLENVAATQTAQKNINLQILRPLQVPVPPLAVQESIVERISKIQDQIDLLEAHSASCRSLVKSTINSMGAIHV